MLRKISFGIVLMVGLLLCPSKPALGQAVSQTPPPAVVLEAVIANILEEKQIEVIGNKQLYQKLEVKITKGLIKGNNLTLESGNFPVVNQVQYKKGDKVLITAGKDFEGNDSYVITDFIRRDPLVVLLLTFLVIVLVIAKWRGVSSLIGMGISFLVIFKFILPQISTGADPVTTAILGSLFIIPLTFFLSHGCNKKTGLAIVGTLISLIVTGSLANIFIEAAKLSGFVSEEAGFLQSLKPGVINIKGLILAGTIIGALGILDDITVAQAAIVSQLKEAVSTLSVKDLYIKAMKVGQDHIASMVNTLTLVYTGSALPLLLLFIDNPRPFSELINYEIFAEEIIRTLVGSIGLVLAVPITTIIAAVVYNADQFIDLKADNKKTLLTSEEDKKFFRTSK